jgi:hypothetical protein
LHLSNKLKKENNMPDSKTISTSLEPVHNHQSHLLCWKSIFAGLLISIMSYMLLASLGAGIVGFATESVIENESSGNGIGTAAGLWMGLSAIISLFLGSYFAVRISKNVTYKVGAAHGFVVASAFFILLTVLAGNAIGALSSGIGRLASGLGSGAANISSNTRVQDTVNQAIGGANLKSEPKVVAEGIAVRLLKGDVESAKSYYAYQSGQSKAEASAKINQIQADFEATAREVGQTASRAVAQTGVSLFITFLVGLAAALFGGRTAAYENVNKPLSENETYTTTNHSAMFANQRGM